MKRKITITIKFAITTIVLVFFLFPIYWIVITAFKPEAEWFTLPPTFWPTKWTLSNFLGTGSTTFGTTTTSIAGIKPFLRNSIVVATTTSIVSTFIAALAAYSISRTKIGGTGLVGWFISMRFLPPIASAIPLYVIFTRIKLLNTWFALILPYLVPTTALSIWLLISFFNEIPQEIEEAAYIDGASATKTFIYVVLPLSAPGLAAAAILSFIQSWGEFLLALVLTSNASAQTLPVYLGRYITGWRVAWGPLSAAGLVTMLPVVIFALITQRFLIRGLTLGAIK
ncbi:carbohydrate ABC transporter permease [Pseudothermotoga thermarum]|uniref:Carbohydrate ABC transporter membrane protein 2, CUT1 family n=1 Tax=Pseudothermotoga thermarum DSM 5069 TaxID=688269 RepID=F7YTH9_9THEM|nr:carbohydrate ABC transporter permease [Pseudothermotoga thermarum]AEH51193.1 carbohydrate ABC transporter membrane protein 2, CUT1 family [Pseudothermotoga thermarum DSM 5069]